MTPAKHALGSAYFYVYLTTIFSILTLGLIGNFLTVLVLCQSHHRQKSLTPFLLNLAAADLIVCLLGYTISGSHQVMWSESPLEDTSRCAWIAFINAFTGFGAIGTLATMSVLTHRNITQQVLASTDRLSARSVCAVLAAIWLYAFVLAVPPAFGWNRFVAVESGISCHPDWTSRERRDVAYITLLLICGFFIPLFLMCYTSAGIIRYLKRTSAGVAEMTESGQNASTKQSRKIAIVVLATVFSFFASWSPYAVVSLGSSLAGQPLTSVSVALVPDLMAKASVVYNPILYVLINGSFRRTLINMLRGSVHRIAPVKPAVSSDAIPASGSTQEPNIKVDMHRD